MFYISFTLSLCIQQFRITNKTKSKIVKNDMRQNHSLQLSHLVQSFSYQFSNLLKISNFADNKNSIVEDYVYALIKDL